LIEISPNLIHNESALRQDKFTSKPKSIVASLQWTISIRVASATLHGSS